MKEPSINILLAEDDENLGKLLWTYLKNKGFDVVLAKNGKLAYDLFNDPKNNFDFLILDVMMPEMDGFTLAAEIRELDKKIPFLFLTAKAMGDDKLKGFDLGADDYLTKPFSMDELLARMKAILNRTKQKKRVPKRDAKKDLKRGGGSTGPAAGGRPQWEGTFGESTYGRRWASPKLCLSQCFRDQHFASLQRPLVSLKAQWPDLQWGMRPQNPATEPWSLCASVPQLS